MNDLVLDGCRPIPLAAYLKALGVLRLVAEQADPAARGWWNSDRFRLRTALGRDELIRFFLHDYRPTPIIAPWNSGSGFYYRERKSNDKDLVTGKKLKLGTRDEETTATKILTSIENCVCERLYEYREDISVARSCLKDLALDAAPLGQDKHRLISVIRSKASLSVSTWIDSAAALLTEGAKYPPLLGSGGNDGNLDFSTNFLQRLSELFDLNTGAPSERAEELLESAIFQSATTGLQDAAIGQFAPGAAGGPNSTAGYQGDPLVNRWDFVLMLEGALVFAGGVSRRLESANAAYLSYPFTVRAAAAGYGSASVDEQRNPRGYELWAPLWEQPARYAEVRALFREGRLSLGTRPARDGLDAARAVGALGVDRGIAGFERYGFVERNGSNYLAAPLGRRWVEPNPRGDLLSDLDRNHWLDRLRRTAASDSASAALRRAVRKFEDGIFALLERRNSPEHRENPRNVQDLLIAFGAAVRSVALRPKLA